MAEYDMPRIPERQLSEFAKSLYGFLYYKIHVYHYRINSSPQFSEIMGGTVLCIRNATRDFNTEILENCGYGVNKLVLCQEVCNLYPSHEYFQRLYYMSAFILEMMFLWYEWSDAVDFSLGPQLWQTIFRDNFESEFENEGGWEGLLAAARHCYEDLLNEVLPSENLLPGLIAGVISRVRALNPVPQPHVVDEAAAVAALENLQMDIDEVPVDEPPQLEEAQSPQLEEELEENQPGSMAQAEESQQESQPKEMDDRSGPHSSTLGGNVAQSENLGQGTSGQSGEEASRGLGDRSLRKRRLDNPSKRDSEEESDSLSPSKAKVEKK